MPSSKVDRGRIHPCNLIALKSYIRCPLYIYIYMRAYREVVAQHVARHGDGVLPRLGALHGEAARRRRVENLHVERERGEGGGGYELWLSKS
jgi:hypothetical protein